MQRVAWRSIAIFSAALALRASADTTDLRGAVFRGVKDTPRIKTVSDNELEFTPDRSGPNLVCKYSRDGESLRVVVTLLGSPQAIYFKFVPDGLQRSDGTILYDAAHFEAASKTAAAERERQLAAALAASVTPTMTPAVTRPIAIYAPRPEYPYEARTRHITGAGVAVMTIDPSSGAVTDAAMAQSTGPPILDNAVVSALRRWRFKPGSYDRHLKVPITYTMTGATYGHTSGD